MPPSSIRPECMPRSFLFASAARIAAGIAPMPVWIQSPSRTSPATCAAIRCAVASGAPPPNGVSGRRVRTSASNRSSSTSGQPAGATNASLTSAISNRALDIAAAAKSTFGPSRSFPSRSNAACSNHDVERLRRCEVGHRAHLHRQERDPPLRESVSKLRRHEETLEPGIRVERGEIPVVEPGQRKLHERDPGNGFRPRRDRVEQSAGLVRRAAYVYAHAGLEHTRHG